jgi:hypothetical protein
VVCDADGSVLHEIPLSGAPCFDAIISPCGRYVLAAQPVGLLGDRTKLAVVELETRRVNTFVLPGPYVDFTWSRNPYLQNRENY